MLKDISLGCCIGTKFMASIGYADDIALIAPSLMPLKKMPHVVCDRYGGSYDVTFNVPKYQLIHYSNYRDELNGIKHEIRFCLSSG